MAEMPHYDRRQLAKRYALLGVGLFVMSMGIAMSRLAELGTTPISCVPAVLSYCTDLTIGQWTIVFNAALVGIQIVVLRGMYRAVELLQMAVAVILGVFVDVSMEILSFIDPASYAEAWLWCLLSCPILGFGVFLEVKANVLTAPGEGVVLSFVRRYRVPFPRMKIVNDCAMVAVGATISLAAMGGLYGVREGTIFCAVTIGPIAGAYRKALGKTFDRALERGGRVPGKWWGPDPETRGQEEIDVVLTLGKGTGIFCECKYRREPVGVGELETLRRRSAPVKGYRTRRFVLFSREVSRQSWRSGRTSCSLSLPRAPRWPACRLL